MSPRRGSRSWSRNFLAAEPQLDLKQPGDGTQPDEIFEKVSDGKVDAGIRRRASGRPVSRPPPCSRAFPSARTVRDMSIGSSRQRRPLYQEMYDHAGMKVHVMPCAFGGAESGGWFAKEIQSKADLKGLRCAFSAPGPGSWRDWRLHHAGTRWQARRRLRKEGDRRGGTLTPSSTCDEALQGQGEAHLRAGLAPARDRARASGQQGSLGRAHRQSKRPPVRWRLPDHAAGDARG